MKNILKKNHIIITALLIMIVIAGYLSFSNKDKPEDTDLAMMTDSDTTLNDEFTTVDGTDGLEVIADTTETGTEDTQTTSDTTETDTDTTDTGNTDATDTSTDTTTGQDTSSTDTDNSEQTDISDEDILATAQDVTDNGELDIEDGVPGEAVLANASIDAGYFISARIDREQLRARNKETLMDIINSAEVSSEDKQVAIKSMTELIEIAEKENVAEKLLEAKGFDGAVVFIVDDQVDVVVNATNLTDQQLAIIEEVIKDKTDLPVDNIHINPAVVED